METIYVKEKEEIEWISFVVYRNAKVDSYKKVADKTELSTA